MRQQKKSRGNSAETKSIKTQRNLSSGHNRAAVFYDSISEHYDTMTGFEQRFVHEKPFFRLLVEKYKIKSALDAGCGTGFHSLLLSQSGVKITAVDVSPEMLARTQVHARQLRLSITTIQSPFQELKKNIHEKFDAVFCMGNSLVHLLSKQDVQTALENFYALLKKDGLLFIQNLNYDRIVSRREKIQSVKENKGKIFVRFYEYGKETVWFNILRLEKKNDTMTYSLDEVELRPLFKEEMSDVLAAAGFLDIQFYGSVKLEPFSFENSKDLVVLGHKRLYDNENSKPSTHSPISSRKTTY